MVWFQQVADVDRMTLNAPLRALIKSLKSAGITSLAAMLPRRTDILEGTAGLTPLPADNLNRLRDILAVRFVRDRLTGSEPAEVHCRRT